MSCLTCKHFKPMKPSNWKPSYSSETFSRYDAVRAMGSTGFHQKGFCHLNPQVVETATDMLCGHYTFFDGPEELTRWFRDRVDNIDRRYWQPRVEKLRRELNAVRKISASRLKRLRELDAIKSRHHVDASSLPQQEAAE